MTEPPIIGDIVRLKSGGPSMTVESIDDQGMVHCIWFNNGKGLLAQRAFIAQALEAVPVRRLRIDHPDGARSKSDR